MRARGMYREVATRGVQNALQGMFAPPSTLRVALPPENRCVGSKWQADRSIDQHATPWHLAMTWA